MNRLNMNFRFSKVLVLLISIFYTCLYFSVRGQEIINIDCNNTAGEFHQLHGFIHGEVNLNQNQQGIKRVSDANFRFWRSANYFDNHLLADSLGFETSLVISDLYAESVGGYENAKPWNDWEGFDQFLSQLFDIAIANDIAPHYYDVWNEPQSTEFWTGTFSQLIEVYNHVYNIAREKNMDLKISGPSIVSYDQNFIETFLEALSSSNIELDAVSWHEFGIPDSLSLHVEQFRELLASNGEWGNPEIHINEYSPRQTNQIPAWKVGWFYHLERSEVDWANNACWDDMDDGETQWNNCIWGLNGVLYYDEYSPLPIYWVHKAYGQMKGDRIFSTGTDSKTVGLAARDGDKLQILTGRYYSIKTGEFLFEEESSKAYSNVQVVISNHPYPIGSFQQLRIEKIAKGDLDFMHSPLFYPDLIINEQIQINESEIVIELNDYQDGDAYLVTINPEQVTSTNQEIMNEQKFYLFPNPSSGKFQISGNSHSDYMEILKIEIYDQFGRRVLSQSPISGMVNLEVMNSGLYIVLVKNQKGKVIDKLTYMKN